jgi:hypothetical protein
LREVGALLDARAFHSGRTAYNHPLWLVAVGFWLAGLGLVARMLRGADNPADYYDGASAVGAWSLAALVVVAFSAFVGFAVALVVGVTVYVMLLVAQTVVVFLDRLTSWLEGDPDTPPHQDDEGNKLPDATRWPWQQ